MDVVSLHLGTLRVCESGLRVDEGNDRDEVSL